MAKVPVLLSAAAALSLSPTSLVAEGAYGPAVPVLRCRRVGATVGAPGSRPERGARRGSRTTAWQARPPTVGHGQEALAPLAAVVAADVAFLAVATRKIPSTASLLSRQPTAVVQWPSNAQTRTTALPTPEMGVARVLRTAASEAGVPAYAASPERDLPAFVAASVAPTEGLEARPADLVRRARRDAAFESSRASVDGAAKPRTAVAGPARRRAVPLLDVVDSPTATTDGEAYAEAPRNASVVVRTFGHALTIASPIAAPCGVSSANTGPKPKAAAIAVLGGPIAALPVRPVALEVAPVVTRKDTAPATALGAPILLVVLRLARTDSRGRQVVVRLKTTIQRSRRSGGPARAAARAVDP